MVEEKGFWAPHTATIDWCESNYVVSDYIAEFWNTLSNLVMILMPLYGVYWSWSHSSYADKYSSKSKPLFRVSKSIVWCHIGLVLVGLGSWAFHMTLLYPAQLLDEIPMIFGSALLIYGNYDILMESFQFDNGKNWRPKSLIGRLLYSHSFVGFAIASYCLFYIYVYLFVWKSPIFHQCAYALMTFVIVGENITLIYRYKLKKRLYMVSLSYYLFGFFLWNLDNAFCPFLQQYRTQVDQFFSLESGSQWKRVLFNVFAVSLKAISEFHSLWHIFTGYAAFMTILFLIEVHYKHFLLVNNKTEEKVQKPIGSRFFNFYYYLSNNLLSTDRDTESKTPKRKKY